MILKIVVDRFEGDKAVLKTEDNDTIAWPKNKLPEDTKEGKSLIFVVSNDNNDNNGLSRDILNEILNTKN